MRRVVWLGEEGEKVRGETMMILFFSGFFVGAGERKRKGGGKSFLFLFKDLLLQPFGGVFFRSYTPLLRPSYWAEKRAEKRAEKIPGKSVFLNPPKEYLISLKEIRLRLRDFWSNCSHFESIHCGWRERGKKQQRGCSADLTPLFFKRKKEKIHIIYTALHSNVVFWRETITNSSISSLATPLFSGLSSPIFSGLERPSHERSIGPFIITGCLLFAFFEGWALFVCNTQPKTHLIFLRIKGETR